MVPSILASHGYSSPYSCYNKTFGRKSLFLFLRVFIGDMNPMRSEMFKSSEDLKATVIKPSHLSLVNC